MFKLLRRLLKKKDNRLRCKDGRFRRKSIHDDPLVRWRMEFDKKNKGLRK